MCLCAPFVKIQRLKCFKFFIAFKIFIQKIKFPPSSPASVLGNDEEGAGNRMGHKAALRKERCSSHPAAGSEGVTAPPAATCIRVPLPTSSISSPAATPLPFVLLLSRGWSFPQPAGMREAAVRTMTPGSPQAAPHPRSRRGRHRQRPWPHPPVPEERSAAPRGEEAQ